MPFPSPGNLPHPEIKLTSLVSPARQEDSLPLSPLGSLGINFYFKEFFLMWMVLKVFIESVTILLLFCVVDFFFFLPPPPGIWDLPSNPASNPYSLHCKVKS